MVLCPMLNIRVDYRWVGLNADLELLYAYVTLKQDECVTQAYFSQYACSWGAPRFKMWQSTMKCILMLLYVFYYKIELDCQCYCFAGIGGVIYWRSNQWVIYSWCGWFPLVSLFFQLHLVCLLSVHCLIPLREENEEKKLY